MRILIVDDGDEKIGPILAKLESLGVRSDAIDIVNSVNGAKVRLRSFQYALALFDLTLGLLPGGSKHHQNGADLVTWVLDDRSRCIQPWRSIVVTCVGEAYDAQHAEIERKGIQVFKWDNVRDETLDLIAREVGQLLHLEQMGALAATTHRVDVCILTALVEPEYSKVISSLPKAKWEDRRLKFANAKIGHVVRDDGAELTLLVLAVGEMGGVPMASMTVDILRTFNPKLIIMAGICGGFAGKAEIGDIICATDMINFAAGKMFDGVFMPDSKSVPTDSPRWGLLYDDDQMNGLLAEVNAKWAGARPTRSDGGSPRFRRGQTGCSDMVVADGAVVKDLLNKYRDMKGVEMEGYGAGYAVRMKGMGSFFLMFKAVCDMADPEKKSEHQEYCAQLSAEFIVSLLLRGIIAPY